VLAVHTLGHRDGLAVPPLPATILVAAHQHDGPAVGIEREQDPHAVVDSQLLEIVDARALDRVDAWSSE
jgi:hypothetical protein